MPRSPEMNQRLRDERRALLCDAALKRFAAKGLAATKISDITQDAGVSQGLFYHYFGSKEEIFVELIGSAFAKMNEAALALEAAPLSPRAKVERAVVQLLGDIGSSEPFVRTVLLIAQAAISDATPPAARAILDSPESRVPYQVMSRIFRAGQRDGSIKDHDPEELALVFWTTIKGLALHRATHGAEFRVPDPDILISVFCMQEG